MGEYFDEIKAGYIEHMGTYNCRTIANSKIMSEHSYGTAIDISKIDGASVKLDWNKNNEKGKILSNAYKVACKYFSNIITPDTDRAHHDHFHLDNGYGRKYSNEEIYSHAVEYEINEVDKSFELIWEYGKERGEELFSPIISDVDYLKDTNTRLITFGSLALEFHYIDSTNISAEYSLAEEIKAKIIETDGYGTVLFEINVISNHLRGSVYRAEKLSLYPY